MSKDNNVHDITSGIEEQLWKVLDEAIDSGRQANINTVIQFCQDIILESISTGRVRYFKEYIIFPYQVYIAVMRKLQDNRFSEKIAQDVGYTLSLQIRDVLLFYMRVSERCNDHLLDVNSVDDYYKAAFTSYSTFLYWITRMKDWRLLKRVVYHLAQLEDAPIDISAQEKQQLRNYQAHIGTPISSGIRTIETKLAIKEKYEEYRRRTAIVLRYWLYFLYQMQEIEEEETLIKLLEAMESQNMIDLDLQEKDVIFFIKDVLKSNLGWSNWQYKELTEGGFNLQPYPGVWIMRGFFLDRLRHKHYFFNGEGLSAVDRTKHVATLLGAVQTAFVTVRDQWERWEKVLSVKTKEEYDNKSNELFDSIRQASHDPTMAEDHQIVAAKLSQRRIDLFKLEAGAKWETHARIRKLFTFFGNKVDLSGSVEKLFQIGPNTFVEKGKFMFIDKHENIPFRDLSDFGAKVGRDEDEFFMDTVQRDFGQIPEMSTGVEALEFGIKKLQESNVNPTVIIIDPNLLKSDRELRKSNKYVANAEAVLPGSDVKIAGYFDGIPVYPSFAIRLKNRFVIADFVNAFCMKYKTSADRYKSELKIDVKIVDEDSVQLKFNENPEKWLIKDDGTRLSEVDAKVLLRTSVIIDTDTLILFQILDRTKYFIGYVKEVI